MNLRFSLNFRGFWSKSNINIMTNHKPETVQAWARSLKGNQPEPTNQPILNSKQRSTLKWKAKQLQIQKENYYD